jgi:ubiquinone/menaquinone biosynthesis C-methylase UbiE
MNKTSHQPIYIKLDQEIIDILCCPLCKGPVIFGDQKFICKNCASEYSSYKIKQGKSEEGVFDFRVQRPGYCLPQGMASWSDIQRGWEDSYFERYSKRDVFEEHLSEIDSVKEIYTKEFNIKGRVLDVGGCDGRLRHFLKKDSTSLYISVDPLINAFQDFESHPNLLKAYSCLSEPCNFIACYAENLPFIAGTFDWIHMRSVLDHFYDPYIALKEAYRVLKPGGFLLAGLTVYGGKSSLKIEDSSFVLRHLISSAICKLRVSGVKGFVEAAVKKMLNKKGWTTHHTFYWKYADLISLLHDTKFDVFKEYWQKPPLDMCVYLGAKKI